MILDMMNVFFELLHTSPRLEKPKFLSIYIHFKKSPKPSLQKSSSVPPIPRRLSSNAFLSNISHHKACNTPQNCKFIEARQANRSLSNMSNRLLVCAIHINVYVDPKTRHCYECRVTPTVIYCLKGNHGYHPNEDITIYRSSGFNCPRCTEGKRRQEREHKAEEERIKRQREWEREQERQRKEAERRQQEREQREAERQAAAAAAREHEEKRRRDREREDERRRAEDGHKSGGGKSSRYKSKGYVLPRVPTPPDPGRTYPLPPRAPTPPDPRRSQR